MTHLHYLNEYMLNSYLRGEHGEYSRLVAQQELWERGQRNATMTEQEMVEELKALGYVVFKPKAQR